MQREGRFAWLEPGPLVQRERPAEESRPIGRIPTGTVPAVPLKPSCVNNYKGRRGGRAAGGAAARRARARAHPADAHRRRFGLHVMILYMYK